jgi:hypothetical protein
LELNFFGLPNKDNPEVGKFCATHQVRLLQELRAVCKEVGGLKEAREMPTEVRQWWLGELIRENEEKSGNTSSSNNTGNRIRTAEIPRGKRGE